MDPREFSRVYNQNRAQISDCYSRASVGGDVQGIMVLRVRVSIEGRVASTRVISNSTHSRALERCVQSAVRGWTYSRPDGGDVEVDYPMRFGPGQ